MKSEYLLKLIIIGDCSVGKTNILLRYCEGTFKNNYTATIGVDFKVKTFLIQNTKIKLQIWDTAGQERFRNIAQTYYKGAAEKWMKQVKDHSSQYVIKILVANKSDVNPEQREVTQLQGRALADRFQIPFMEVSAKNGNGISEIFQLMGKKIFKEYIPILEKQEPKIQLKKQQKEESKKKKKCDC